MTNLRLPGPTPVPADVIEAMGQPMIDHRGAVFRQVLERLSENLQHAFETRNEVFVLTSSGTGAMEAAIVNTLSPHEKVLAVSIGNFGDRFSRIAKVYGAEVADLKFPEGEAAEPDVVRQALRDHPDVTAVLITHNETSTGITNDMEALADVIKGEFDKLLLVDAISSLGSIRLPMDEWGLDVVISASQKGWMCPPGLAMISLSERAWHAATRSTMPKFYLDLTEARRSARSGQTPWTPAVSLVYGLDYALQRMLASGDMQAVYDFHAHIAQYTRNGLLALGLNLVAKSLRHASNTVTACYLPSGISDRDLLDLLERDHDIVAAEGRGTLTGKVFRIGHMGHVTEADIDGVLDALKVALPRLGSRAAGASDS